MNVGDLGSIPGLGRSPGEGNGNLLQYSCLENSKDRQYSPWGHKELDMTKQLTLLPKALKQRGLDPSPLGWYNVPCVFSPSSQNSSSRIKFQYSRVASL